VSWPTVSNSAKGDLQVESIINAYISHELVRKPEMLPLDNSTPLLESGVLDSLSILKLVLFLEEQFGIVVAPEDVIPENFATIDTICGYLRIQQHMQRSAV
jgi:acyl carrier protein